MGVLCSVSYIILKAVRRNLWQKNGQRTKKLRSSFKLDNSTSSAVSPGYNVLSSITSNFNALRDYHQIPIQLGNTQYFPFYPFQRCNVDRVNSVIMFHLVQSYYVSSDACNTKDGGCCSIEKCLSSCQVPDASVDTDDTTCSGTCITIFKQHIFWSSYIVQCFLNSRTLRRLKVFVGVVRCPEVHMTTLNVITPTAVRPLIYYFRWTRIVAMEYLQLHLENSQLQTALSRVWTVWRL